MLKELVDAVDRLLDNPPCMDYDCCEVAFAHEAARKNLEEVLKRARAVLTND